MDQKTDERQMDRNNRLANTDHQGEALICTTPDCTSNTSLYLCTNCIIELDELLQDVAFLHENLDPSIQATKVVKTAGNEGGNGTRVAGSRPPISLDAELLRTWLGTLPYSAHAHAMECETAGQTLHMARIWVGNARTLVWGPEDNAPTPHELKTMRNELAQQFPDPMPPRQCATWLRENAGIKIAARNINDWYHRGRIRKQEGSTPKRPLYSPKEVLIAHMTRQHE